MTNSTLFETTMRRIAFLLPVAGLLVLGSCHSDSNESDIKPIRASVSFPNPAPSGPSVFLRAAANDNPDDDVVPLEVVLDSGAGITFDAFNIEILPTDPANPGLPRDGIVQITFDAAAGATPFGACNSCYATAACGAIPPAVPAACTACSTCPAIDPAGNPVNSPLCFGGPSSSNSFLASAAVVGSSGCGPTALGPGAQTVLAILPIFARTTGSARLRFVVNPLNLGDSEVLLANVSQPVTFDDRGAVFTAGR
jgi:hypothetical protein